MKIYHYDPKTRIYVGQSEAMLDPLELQNNNIERWLLPANATFDEPPECPSDKLLIMDETWMVVDAPILEPTPIEPTSGSTESTNSEMLIQAKLREIAIAALRDEGILI